MLMTDKQDQWLFSDQKEEMLNSEQLLGTAFSYTHHPEQQRIRLSLQPVMARDRAHYALVSGRPIMIACPEKEGRNSVHRR